MQIRNLWLLVSTCLAMLGCATKTYVDERLSGVESRVQANEVRIAELSETSRQALERATDAGKLAQGKFLYTVVFTHEDVMFDSDDFQLSNGTRTRLNQLAGNLLADNQNVYLEIQGHTDATGPADYNHYLGLMRAESVRRHLHAQGVSLGRMATISYGENAPVDLNSTADGRARNRRVEVVVLN